MPPAPYVHVTITVPGELHPTLPSNQPDGYSLLIKATAEAIISSPAIVALSWAFSPRA